MKNHDEFCQEGRKEKHFFDKELYQSTKGYNAYLKEYQNCPQGTFTMDATPAYIEWDGDGTERSVPARLKESYSAENLKKKKFMLILRCVTATAMHAVAPLLNVPLPRLQRPRRAALQRVPDAHPGVFGPW